MIIWIYYPALTKSFKTFFAIKHNPMIYFCFPHRRQALRVQPVSETLHEERPPDEALQDSHKHQEPVSCLFTDCIRRQTLKLKTVLEDGGARRRYQGSV